MFVFHFQLSVPYTHYRHHRGGLSPYFCPSASGGLLLFVMFLAGLLLVRGCGSSLLTFSSSVIGSLYACALEDKMFLEVLPLLLIKLCFVSMARLV